MFVMANNVMWHSVGNRFCNLNARRLQLAAASSGQANAAEKSISGYALGPQRFGGTITNRSSSNWDNTATRPKSQDQELQEQQQQQQQLRRPQRQKLLVKKMSSEVVL